MIRESGAAGIAVVWLGYYSGFMRLVMDIVSYWVRRLCLSKLKPLVACTKTMACLYYLAICSRDGTQEIAPI
jgi:hypothetical protein